jgi:hypothetical protein
MWSYAAQADQLPAPRGTDTKRRSEAHVTSWVCGANGRPSRPEALEEQGCGVRHGHVQLRGPRCRQWYPQASWNTVAIE